MKRTLIIVVALLLFTATPAGAARTQLHLHTAAPDGYIFPGDSVFVSAYVFLPKVVCGKKPKFWIVDGAGKRHKLGKRRVSFKFDPRGQVYKPLKDLPRDAKPGRGWFKSRQKCTPLSQTVKIRGRQRLTIVDPAARPEIQNVRAPDGFTGERFNMKFALTDQSRVEAWIEYELTPGRWVPVDSLTKKAFYRKKGNYTLRWGGKVAGDRVPAGHYRFAIQTRALNLFSEQRGPTITDDFFVIQALAAGQFTEPIDAEVTSGDRIVVADGQGNRLQVIGFDGSVAQSVPGLDNPQDVAISDAHEWFVVTADDRRVVRFSNAGTELGSFGTARFDEGSGPQGITYGPQGGGRIYVADTGPEIEVFSTTGTSLGPFGSGLETPRALDVAADGSLWVKESAALAHLRAGDGGLLGRTPIGRPLSGEDGSAGSG